MLDGDHDRPEGLCPLEVFLCHASEDKIFVREIHAWFKRAGLMPWLDERDLLPGQEWRPAIENAVRRCHVFVVCLSRHAITKEGFIQREIRQALDVADEKPP